MTDNQNVTMMESGAAAATNPQPPGGFPAKQLNVNSTPIDQVLTRKHLQEMSKEVDPNEQLDDDVEEFLLSYAEEYMEKIIEGACNLATHRKSTSLETKDVQTYLERTCNFWSPGFGTDELRTYKRLPITESHKQRVALIKKTVKKY
jgi:transcription initiation factor TFIID subunit 12